MSDTAQDAPKGALVAEPSDGTSSKPVNAVNQNKQPPPETQESIFTRRLVVFSFWAVVIFLGLPIWWKTTSIYRANLPVQTMMDWADNRVWCEARARHSWC